MKPVCDKQIFNDSQLILINCVVGRLPRDNNQVFSSMEIYPQRVVYAGKQPKNAARRMAAIEHRRDEIAFE